MTSQELMTPVSEEDVLDQEDYLESLYNTQMAMFQRVQAQAGNENPLTIEMWNICCLMDQASKRLSGLRGLGVFTADQNLPVRQG